jgi:Fe-S cluster assembly protein SufD
MLTDYQKAFESLQAVSPPWLRGLREEGFAHFERLGWPTRRHEEWKYTSTKELQAQCFQLSTPAAPVDTAALAGVRVEGAIELVFVDGLFRPELSLQKGEPAGVTIEILAGRPDARQCEWLRPLQGNDSMFAGLNAALFQDSLLVDVAEKTICEPLIHIVHLFSQTAGQAMAFPRQTIRVGRFAQAAVLQTLISGGEGATLLDAVTGVTVGENAQLAYGVIQAESHAAAQVQNTRVQLADDSRLESFTLTTGGKWVRNELAVTLQGANIHAVVNGLYTVQGQQHVDNHTVIEHCQPHSFSSQLYKGVLDEQGRAVFNGKIFVHDIAQQTNAYQLNRNLLLSPTAEADTKPQLEIFADDVRCTHGATVGPVNPDEIFYLETRGMPRERAVRILSQGFAREAVGRITEERLRPVLDSILSCHFGEHEV